MAAVTPICLNGKFTAMRMTGVQRVAACLVQALDAQIDASDTRWSLLCPAGGVAPKLRRIGVRHVGWAGLPLHVWEQIALPRAARGGLLVNLAGAAPWFAPRQVCLMHDAAMFDHPEAYTRAFVAWYRRLFLRLARRASRLVTVSEFSRTRLALHLGIGAARIAVVPNGCDHLDAIEADERVIAQHGLGGTRFLLAVASANPTKNLAALVAAYARLPEDPSRRLVIVGGANERVFVASAASDPPGVVRTGAVGDAALKALYRHAVGLVCPSVYEGFGLVPLEAMACGCPVAVADVAALPEVCGDAALRFDPHSEAAIVAVFARLAGDAALRERLRAAGLARAASFRWAASALRLRDELETVHAAGPRR